MYRKLLLLGGLVALIALLILTRVPGPHEPVTQPFPCRAAWIQAEQVIAGPAPPPPDVYAQALRRLEVVCGDPAGATFIESTLHRWPAFEPALRARAAQAIRHGQVLPRTAPLRTAK